MKLFSEKMQGFTSAHPSEELTAGGARFRYVLSGNGNGQTLVFLNGGMNTLEMWVDYVDALARDERVLLFDYPQELRTNQELVEGMHALFQALGVERPVFIGASDGGMDANTLKSLRRKYRLAPLMLWYLKHCNYEKLKPTLIKAGMGHIRNESAEEITYARDMFETIFRDYKREKDVHISGLLADLMNQTPVTAANFADLAGKILLILPDQDFFSGEMQADLVRLMHDPKIAYVSGGHLSTVLRADDYIRTIRAFLHQTDGAQA